MTKPASCQLAYLCVDSVDSNVDTVLDLTLDKC
jgi:hypothetical protein